MQIEGGIFSSYNRVIICGGNMSSLLDELFYYLKISEDERLDKAFNTSKILVGYLEPMFDDDKAYQAYVQIFSIFCCADGICLHMEYDFYKKLTEGDITYDQFTEWMDKEYGEVDLNEFFEFAGRQDDEFNETLKVFMLCVVTCDYSLHSDELQMIDEFF